MGLDNFWLVPTQTEENLANFNKASEYPDDDLPDNVEFETAHYQGENELNLVGGLFSNNGNGSFRGKYYSALCDAMLDDDGWLYSFHYKGEIEDAYEQMKTYLEKFQSSDGEAFWQEFVKVGKTSTRDYYNFFDSYTIEEAIDFIKMFEYYSTVENICLSAWY